MGLLGLSFNMEKERLEFHLNKGTEFGYNIKNDADSIAWVLLSKRFPINQFFERNTRDDNEALFDEQIKIKQHPYNVWVAEITRDAYEREKFPQNDDYLISESYYFSTLDEAEVFLFSLGLRLPDIKWSSEVEFL